MNAVCGPPALSTVRGRGSPRRRVRGASRGRAEAVASGGWLVPDALEHVAVGGVPGHQRRPVVLSVDLEGSDVAADCDGQGQLPVDRTAGRQCQRRHVKRHSRHPVRDDDEQAEGGERAGPATCRVPPPPASMMPALTPPPPPLPLNTPSVSSTRRRPNCVRGGRRDINRVACGLNGTRKTFRPMA